MILGETFSRHELPHEDQLKYIGFMFNDVGRLLDNINRILQLARIESGNYAREFVRLDLVETVKRFRDENADLFPNSIVTIENPAKRPFPFNLNVQLFDVLLMNLFSTCREGEISLTEQEVKLLKLFVANRGKPLTRREILEVGWGYKGNTPTRTVDNFVMRFRKYFEDNAREPVFFKSLRSMGYVFDHEG